MMKLAVMKMYVNIVQAWCRRCDCQHWHRVNVGEDCSQLGLPAYLFLVSDCATNSQGPRL